MGRSRRARSVAGAAVLGVALTATACGGSSPPDAAPAPVTDPTVPTTVAPPTAAEPSTSVASDTPAPMASVATAKGRRVEIYNSPVQPEPARTLDNPQPSGAAPGGTFPLRMLVVEERGDWLKVLLPIRPNGSSGWLRRAAVDVETHDYRVLVELGAHQITVWKGADVVLQEPVGVGASGRTPTTTGLFYTTEHFEVIPSQRAAYGPYAFALSGFSEVLHSFGDGGTGVLGIHGTSDTSSLGRDVSNGCIRMSNSGITKLHEILPLGVPVEIKQ